MTGRNFSASGILCQKSCWKLDTKLVAAARARARTHHYALGGLPLGSIQSIVIDYDLWVSDLMTPSMGQKLLLLLLLHFMIMNPVHGLASGAWTGQ